MTTGGSVTTENERPIFSAGAWGSSQPAPCAMVVRTPIPGAPSSLFRYEIAHIPLLDDVKFTTTLRDGAHKPRGVGTVKGWTCGKRRWSGKLPNLLRTHLDRAIWSRAHTRDGVGELLDLLGEVLCSAVVDSFDLQRLDTWMEDIERRGRDSAEESHRAAAVLEHDARVSHARWLADRRAERDARREGARRVYLMDNGSLWKIGISTDVHRRMLALRASGGHPITVMLTFVGGRDEEAALHKEFAHLRQHGEWFTPDPAILDAFRAHGAVQWVKPKRQKKAPKAPRVRLP